MANVTRLGLLPAPTPPYIGRMLTPELEEAYGPDIDKAVDKVGGLLPLEWSSELRSEMRRMVADAHLNGVAASRLADSEMRRSF